MAFNHLVLKGNKMIGPGNAGTLVNVNTQILDFKCIGKRNVIQIPESYGSLESVAAGGQAWMLEIRYFQDSGAADSLTEIFATAMADPTGTINFSGTFRDAAISATNPARTGIALVAGVELGGTVNTVGIVTVSMPMTGPPVLDITP